MENQVDAKVMLERARLIVAEVRKSEAYPAILGAIAGGVAGALMAVIIAGGRSARRGSDESSKTLGASARPGWSPRDVVQLATVVAALAKQVQSWYQEQKR